MKRFSSMICGTLLMVAMLFATTPVQASVFKDVADNAWYAKAVSYCYDHNYFAGVSATEFGPDIFMDRAMLVTVLYRHAGEPTVEGVNPFSDVDDESWYGDAVIWGSQEGIVAGYTDRTFRPTIPVTRQEMMAFFQRYSAYLGKCASIPTKYPIYNSFTDTKNVGAWAVNSVRWGTESGMLCGSEGKLLPLDRSTRSQVASVMMRLDSLYAGKMKTISSSAGANGSVVPAGSFSIVEGSAITFRAVPNNRCVVSNVVLNGVSKGKYNSYTVSTNQNSQTIRFDFRKLAGSYNSGMGQLVNRTYPIPNASSYHPSDLKTVRCSVSGRNVQLRSEAATALDKMVDAYHAAYPSSTLKAQSGYRTNSYQVTLYNNQISRKGNKYAAGVVSAVPGTSEHELGLAVDLTRDGTLLESFGSTQQGKWLAAHCREYGFILRYPADKQLITGIIYEPWHFRYVGKDVVDDMRLTGATTLEEYYGLYLAPKDIDKYKPYLK